MTPPSSRVLERIVKFSSLSVLPVLGFIGVYMFNGLDSIKSAQSDSTAHIKVLEQTLPYVNDGVKRNTQRIDSLEQNIMQQAPGGVDAAAKTKADARRDAQIRHLQEVIKELTAKGWERHSENQPLVDAQNKLASLILN